MPTWGTRRNGSIVPTHLRLDLLEGRTLPSVLVDYGSYVTGIGNGFLFANTSAVEPGGHAYGFNCLKGSYHVADDFDLPASAAGWQISSIKVLAYQTGLYGFPPNNPITGIYLRLWDGTPGAGGQVLAETSDNLFDSGAWTGVYRVDASTPLNPQRPIMEIVADTSAWTELQNLGPLPEGHYWIEWSLTGNSYTGPWAPPTVPKQESDNARMFNETANTWGDLLDVGGLGQQDLLFQVNGDEAPARFAPGKESNPAMLATASPPVVTVRAIPLSHPILAWVEGVRRQGLDLDAVDRVHATVPPAQEPAFGATRLGKQLAPGNWEEAFGLEV